VAYVMADYLLKYPTADRAVAFGGIATLILVGEQGRTPPLPHGIAPPAGRRLLIRDRV
jgi:hypothetical protein